MRPVFQWNLGARSLELGKRTLIMGIVNVTPDSFSDGGQFLDPDKALAHAERLLSEGADIVDIGGESTRPGARVDAAAGSALKANPHAPPVSAEEELKRILPVIGEFKNRHPQAVVSVDTYKAAVARSAIEAGAEIVNDVSGFRWDPQMAWTVADRPCGAVLMHMRGRPEEWRLLPRADDIAGLVKRELQELSEAAVLAGVRRERIVLDPGFGFGKNFEENYPLIGQFHELHALRFPLLTGVSRKSFIGRTVAGGVGKVAPEERLSGTLAAETALILKGAHILRTHDVKASLEAARVADAILLAS
ncbi:MAG TPA: dihydropteroate synthase [Candidatus Sulfotelmatobacter sp.]|nr:dihydropteroate synthase [Candidatus Sulfotelmatobacter sp.]